MKNAMLFLLFCLCAITAAPAQSVVIYGKVKNLGIYATVCWHSATHGLEETNIKIKKTTINLKALEGKVARLEGTMSPGMFIIPGIGTIAAPEIALIAKIQGNRAD